MSNVLGVTKVSLNGNDPGTLPGTEVDLGGFDKAEVFASGKLAGFSRTPVAFSLTCKFVFKSSTDLERIRKFEGQCDFITDVDQIYSSADATIVSPPKIQGDGISCTIKGTAMEKTKG